MPTVSATGAQRTPTLHHLARDVDVEIELVRAQALAMTAAERLELADLTASGGRIARAAQRLASMSERLQEIQAAGPHNGRRFGEHELPDELISTRRQREHARRVKQARKRVEDERTAMAELLSRQKLLETKIAQELSQAEAHTRVVGGIRRSQATSYLLGALRKHPDRPLLSAHTPALMPSTPTATAFTEPEVQL